VNAASYAVVSDFHRLDPRSAKTPKAQRGKLKGVCLFQYSQPSSYCICTRKFAQRSAMTVWLLCRKS